jgi:hypothetical protein
MFGRLIHLLAKYLVTQPSCLGRFNSIHPKQAGEQLHARTSTSLGVRYQTSQPAAAAAAAAAHAKTLALFSPYHHAAWGRRGEEQEQAMVRACVLLFLLLLYLHRLDRLDACMPFMHAWE